MGFIYKITNKLNNKVYIGQTKNNPSERWKQHIRTSKNSVFNGKSKIIRALRKYPIDIFLFEILEEIETEQLDEREEYWIEFYKSYTEIGYNILKKSKGNNRKLNITDEEIIEKYLEISSVEECAEILSLNYNTVRNVLRNSNIKIKRRKLVVKNKQSSHSKVVCFTKDDKFIDCFNSIKDAIAYFNLPKKASGHISKCCQKKRPSAYGYKWRYKHETEMYSVSPLME